MSFPPRFFFTFLSKYGIDNSCFESLSTLVVGEQLVEELMEKLAKSEQHSQSLVEDLRRVQDAHVEEMSELIVRMCV